MASIPSPISSLGTGLLTLISFRTRSLFHGFIKRLLDEPSRSMATVMLGFNVLVRVHEVITKPKGNSYFGLVFWQASK